MSSPSERRDEGSALLLAVLVAAVLAVLGIAFLLMAETESRIAENEERAAQARAAAQSAALVVKAWLDRPRDPDGPPWPPDAVVDRGLRRIDHDGDPATPARPQDGARWPRYKQGVDRDGDGRDDLFERPYRGGLLDALSGTADGPDARIDADASPAARSYLDDLSRRLFGGFPGRARGVEVRLRRLDLYQPPWVPAGGSPVRHGVGTVAATVAVYRQDGGLERVVAEHTVRAVLAEIPYRRPFGPLQACADIAWREPLGSRWGAVAATGTVMLSAAHAGRPASWPRAVPADPRRDLVWGWDDPLGFDAYRDAIESAGEAIEDPWLRVVAGGTLAGAPPGVQPYPFRWDPTVPDPLGDGTRPNHDHPIEDGTHSNLFQRLAVTCPDFDHAWWRAIAMAGGRDVHYYAWHSGELFREDGAGPPLSFRELTDDREGIFFFDTRDGEPPRDADGDGRLDNLTPPVRLTGGNWSVRGMVYLNAESFSTTGVVGRPVTLRAPGEPFADANGSGRFDPGERWVNLRYPTGLGGPFLVDSADDRRDDGTRAGFAVRNGRGPAMIAPTVLHGVLVLSGTFKSRGDGRYYGSVVARSGVFDPGSPATAPEIYWDEDLATDWPPPGVGLPRVAIVSWRD